jgi:hypothetical protein
MDEVKLQTNLPFPKVLNCFLTPSSNAISSQGGLNLVYKNSGTPETFFTTETMSTGIHYLFDFFEILKKKVKLQLKRQLIYQTS